MDFEKLIKDLLPDGIEVDSKTISSIAKEINKQVGEHTIPKAWYANKKTEWDNERQKMELELTDLKGGDNGIETIKAELKAEKKAHSDTKKALDTEKAAHQKAVDGYTAEKEAATVDSLVSELLKTGSDKTGTMNAAAIPKALKQYDRSIVERDSDGKITNSDKVLEHFVSEWADFFGASEVKGADVGNPPNGNLPEKNPWLKENKSLSKQTQIYKENPQLAVKMAKEAGITLKG